MMEDIEIMKDAIEEVLREELEKILKEVVLNLIHRKKMRLNS